MITELEKLQAAAEKYSYNPETGVFVYEKSPCKAKIGTEAGSWFERKLKGHTNYYQRLWVSVDGTNYQLYAHRVAWFITYGEIPDSIDHIEHARRKDQSLNRIKNLRNGNARDNASNLTRGTSKYTGVSLNASNRWRACIDIDGKQVNLGTFGTEKEASEAYQKRKPI